MGLDIDVLLNAHLRQLKKLKWLSGSSVQKSTAHSLHEKHCSVRLSKSLWEIFDWSTNSYVVAHLCSLHCSLSKIFLALNEMLLQSIMLLEKVLSLELSSCK